MKKFVLLCAVAAVAAGCTKINEMMNGRFTCTLPEMAVTRTAVEVDGSTAKLTWSREDKIMINGVPYILATDTKGLRTAEFVRTSTATKVPEAPYRACFPAEFYSPQGVMLPAVQRCDEDGSLTGVLPLYAESNDMNLNFKNICGLLSIDLNGNIPGGKVTKVEISADQPLSGLWSPETGEFLSNGERGTIVLDCGDGLELDCVYAAVPAGKYTNLVYRLFTVEGEIVSIKEDERIVEDCSIGNAELIADYKSSLEALGLYMNYIYGSPDWYMLQEIFTDEYTYSYSAPEWARAAIDSTSKIPADNPGVSRVWGASYSCINLACRLIEGLREVGVGNSEIAEARFYRGFSFFNLVRMFGGVPLDLGAGELKYNYDVFRGLKVRKTVSEVYESAVLPDLEMAAENLPLKPRYPGGPSKTAARIALANAYLSYAWFLENPQAIPIFPEQSRDASRAQSYYDKAFKMAKLAIDDTGDPFELMPTFAEVQIAQNDYRNTEVVLYADHRKDDFAKDLVTYGWDLGTPCNLAGQLTNWRYDKSAVSGSGVKLMTLDDCQPYGYPAAVMAPIPDALKKFTDVDKDSRWDGTFNTVYRGNWKKAGYQAEEVIGAFGSQIKDGDPLLQFLPYDDPNVVYARENLDLNAGTLPGHTEYVINISDVSRETFPACCKNIGQLIGRASFGSPSSSSRRPYCILKLSEAYLIAAEAAVKLGKPGKADGEAGYYINFLRGRAGKWAFNRSGLSNGEYAKEEYLNEGKYTVENDYSSELTEATPETMTIDVVLDERLRELWGEGMRRDDLVRTQTLHERAKVYHISDGVGRQAAEHVRDIKKPSYLRPIPQAQVDLTKIQQNPFETQR
ncbi:MAG: RagB/SusD family nutrient uptake outer membrane protein [Bacteroidales bacterium]|nr:RagB/SusD family nutrient uptake outer membrane protein [Bacteroidales bacterium]